MHTSASPRVNGIIPLLIFPASSTFLLLVVFRGDLGAACLVEPANPLSCGSGLSLWAAG